MATNNCEIYSAIRRPLDAFVKYFLDVKPYHTKLLEVLEIYKFYDTINVKIEEDVFKEVIIMNKPLCHGTGWGVNWDDECGFDALSCCDLFDCIGGYGLIYDNSDLLVSENILQTTTDGTITISGNFTYDIKLPIKSILNQSQFSVKGNHVAQFNTNNVFLVIPRHVYNIGSVLSNGFVVDGDIASETVARRNFIVYGSKGNDGSYDVNTAHYDSSTNKTTIITVQHPTNVSGTGFIQINSPNKNNGVYQTVSATFTGIDTIVTVNTNHKRFDYLHDVTNGSIQFRSRLIYPRHVSITNSVGSPPNNDGDYKILQSIYNYTNNTTTITVSGLIRNATTNQGKINLYGYEFEAGFDGGEECSIPKPSNIHMIFSERLVINVTSVPAPSPTPTPTPSPVPSEAIVMFAQSDGKKIGLLKHDGINKTELANVSPDDTDGQTTVDSLENNNTYIFAAVKYSDGV